MNKECQLSDADGPLVICRGCTLSGELHVGHAAKMCELCEDHEPLTANSMKKLGGLLLDKARRIDELLAANMSYQQQVGGLKAEIKRVNNSTAVVVTLSEDIAIEKELV